MTKQDAPTERAALLALAHKVRRIVASINDRDTKLRLTQWADELEAQAENLRQELSPANSDAPPMSLSDGPRID